MLIVEARVNMKIFSTSDLVLKEGKEYVMADAAMYQITKMNPGSLVISKDFKEFYKKFDCRSSGSAKKILFFRSGGIGDVMFMLPLINFLKTCREFSETKMTLATSPMYCCLTENNPLIDRTIPMPFGIEELLENDYHLMFEGVIEGGTPESKRLNAIDLFFLEAGVDFTKIPFFEKTPFLFLSEEEKRWGSRTLYSRGFLQGERKRVGIQVEASSPVRSFPLDTMITVIRRLLSMDIAVFIFGGNRQKDISLHLKEIFKNEKRVFDLISKDFSLRESVILASFMDAVIAPDSAFIHICGGLRIPGIGLYGCFPSESRMKYYQNSIGIDCHVACSPGFIHGHRPCDKGFPSPCFSVISANNILDAVSHILFNEKIPLKYPTYNEYKGGNFVQSPFSVRRGEDV